MRILVINGPNLNNLGRREPSFYGSRSLSDIEGLIQEKANDLGLEVAFFQSNHEGAIIDYLQGEAGGAAGVIINPGALAHYSLALHDALLDCRLPVVEVHLSNIYAREEWRQKSVTAPAAAGQIAGLGWRGYLYALEFLASHIREEGSV